MTSLSVASDMTEPKEGPLYARVHQALVEAIQRGKLAPGTVLPTEKELGEAVRSQSHYRATGAG